MKNYHQRFVHMNPRSVHWLKLMPVLGLIKSNSREFILTPHESEPV
jgi:hypothetical protein